MLYPNSANLVVSIQRVLDFDAAPDAVECLMDDFPSDPVDIEKAVLSRITYRHDWDLYGMPWYCPTIEQVLERSAGDCKARALVLASILDAKEIDYLIHSSPTHSWVQYERKQENSIENAQVEFYEYDHETGERKFRVPDIGLGTLMDTWEQQFWTPMPDGRKTLLMSGLVGLITARLVLRKRKSVRQTRVEDSASA